MPPSTPSWAAPCLLFNLFVLLIALAPVRAQQPLYPVPVAIRSPYMNVWHTDAVDALGISWPCLWRGSACLGWAGKIKVDGHVYAWMGHDNIDGADEPANTTAIEFTPTRSIFHMQAGPMNVTVTFLSPIEPSDWVKQSFPFIYLYVDVSSLDGAAHSVQLFSDTTAEWISGDTQSITASNYNTGTSLYHQVQLQNPQPYQEVNDHSEDGKLYFAMGTRPGITWQIGGDDSTRKQFRDNSGLLNTAITNFTAPDPIRNFVYAIAVDLGNIQSTSSPVVWSIGHVRDPSVKYTTASGATQQRRPYFSTQYSDMGQAIDAFTGDFTNARQRAIALDSRITQDASKVSQNYADLVSLAARQSFSLDLTVGTDDKGNPDASDVMAFVKDIGASSRTNPVERIYAAFPAYIYLNASIGGALLRPLLESQEGQNGQPQPYAARDLGTSYPIAAINSGIHGTGIEETGNMLIMMYAHARISGDGSLLARHYNLTKRWADYLVNSTLVPTNQVSADAEQVANLTNLALKGIIGVKAAAEISRVVGMKSDAQHYDNQASSLMGSWQSLATSSDGQRVLGVYGDDQSWSLLYNLYADKLLGTKLVPDSVLEGEKQSLLTVLSGTSHPFGVPIDNTIGTTCSAAWSLFTAATVTDQDVRDKLIEQVWARTFANGTQGAFPDMYSNVTGNVIANGGTASPALGAMFSLLALNVPSASTINTTIAGADGVGGGNNPEQTGGGGGAKSSSQRSVVGPIVGGVVGGFSGLGLAAIAFVVWRRKRRGPGTLEKQLLDPERYSAFVTPFGASYEDMESVPRVPHVADTHSSEGAVADRARDSAPGGQSAAGPGPQTQTQTQAAPLSSKAQLLRERELQREMVHAGRGRGGTAVSSVSSASASNADPLVAARGEGRTDGSWSVADSEGTSDAVLRHEVAELRRALQEMRIEQFEAPPEYRSDAGAP